MGLFIVHVASSLLLTALTYNNVRLMKEQSDNLSQQWVMDQQAEGLFYICNEVHDSCLGTLGLPLHWSLVGAYDKTSANTNLLWGVNATTGTIFLANSPSLTMQLINGLGVEYQPVDVNDDHVQSREQFQVSSTPKVK